MKEFANLPGRLKAGLLLTIAERVMDELNDREGNELARAALDLAWKWYEGGCVSGDELFAYLFRDDDDGLLYFEELAASDEVAVSAWIVVSTTVLFVSKEAYKAQKVRSLPDPLYEVDDNAIIVAIDSATKAHALPMELVEIVVRKLLDISNQAASQLHSSISREALCRLGG